jgi:hypothetical protein
VDTPSSARRPVVDLVNTQDRHQPRSKNRLYSADVKERSKPQLPGKQVTRVQSHSPRIQPGPAVYLTRTWLIPTVRLWSSTRLPDGQPVGCP